MSFLARIFALLLSIAGIGVALDQPVNAQSPAIPASRVNLTHDAHQILQSMAMMPDGRMFVLWEYDSIFGHEIDFPERLLLREYPVTGAATDPFVLYRTKGGGCCFMVRMSVNESGQGIFIFDKNIFGGIAARRFGSFQGPSGFWIPASSPSEIVPEAVVLDQSGGFVTIWASSGQETPDQADLRLGLFGRRYDPTGHPISPEFHVNTYRRNTQRLAAIAMDRSSGNFVVVWQSKEQDGSGLGLYGQRFAANTEKLGGEFLIPTTTAGDQGEGAIAMDLKGNFVVAWRGADPANPDRNAIFAQRFKANGERIGGEFQVSEAIDGFEDDSKIAMDGQGNFVITWNHWPEGLAYTRLYRANGTPVRDPVQLTLVPGYILPQPGFAANGTFGVAWTDVGREEDLEDVYVQRFSASPGNEFCLFRRGELICDTGRTGGDPEVRYPFGGQAGEIGLLGDVDGDGRADLCLFLAGVFRCDTGHDFGAAETRIRFGQSGDVPLLGDVDGDGKADPCVYRSGQFLCSTAHDGNVSQTIAFGQPGDVPLLGDVDGDGRADPCVFRKGVFLCDTKHDGSVNVTLPFGQPGDVPLLGDFDGDGKADPCVYRAGQLLCDTKHDGTIGGRLTFGDGDGAPLLGNLDGL
ncbi:MAG TPA: hypothetical protein VGM86_01440 [Thermoanaerobaculia bacterium]